MRRRKTAVAAGCCLAFLLGTLLNVLFIPGSEHPPPPPRDGVPPSTPGARLYPPEEEGGGGGRAALARQIRERYEEVLRYRQHRAVAAAAAAGRRPLRPRERRLMDLAPPRTSAEQPGPRGRALGPRAGASAELSLEPPLLGCRDIRNVSGVQYLGSGYTKAVYKAVLNRTLAVALKAVDFGGHDIAHCVRQFSALGDCYRLAAYKIVKEMILLQRLRHANVLQVRGSVDLARGGWVALFFFAAFLAPLRATCWCYRRCPERERAGAVPRSPERFFPLLSGEPQPCGEARWEAVVLTSRSLRARWLLISSPHPGSAGKAGGALMGAFRRRPRNISGAHPPPTSASPQRGAPDPGPGPGKGAGCGSFPCRPVRG